MPKIYTCSNCKSTVFSVNANGLCTACERDEWDAGFEASSDWGAKVAHSDFISTLNDALQDKVKALEVIDKIMYYFDPGDWKCYECGEIFVTKDAAEQMSHEAIYSAIIQDCPVCKKNMGVDHDFKGER